MKKNILLLFCFLFCINIYTQERNPNKVVTDFFQLLEKNNSDKALDFLFSSNEYIGSEEIKPIKKRIKQYQQLLGGYHGFDLLIEQKVTKSIIVYSYIVKYDRQPLRFIFTFYKAKDEWKIFNFKINDDFISEFEEGVIRLSYEKN